MVATSFDIAKELQQKFLAMGISVKAKNVTADLGVDRGTVVGGRPKLAKRRKMAASRLQRVYKVARLSKCTKALAKKLLFTGIGPQRTYAAGVFGVAPSVVLSWRRSIGRTLSPGMRGRCLDTFLQLEVGARDPHFATAFQVLDAWIYLLSQPAHRKRAERAWPRARKLVLSRPPNKRWRRATGVTYAVICLLLDIGWQPDGPWDWVSDVGERFCVPDDAWDSGEELDWGPFKVAFSQGLSRVLWRRAARHYCGGGLEAGADLTGVSQQLRRLRSKGKFEWFGAILTSVVGAQWPRTRLRDAGIELETIFCQRCGDQVEETLLHRCWQCKANAEIPACRKTEYLQRRALRDAGNQPCVWLRGLLPRSWTQLSPPPDDHGEVVAGPPFDSSWFWEGRLVASGDASGGPYSSDKRLRRVGWAYSLFRASRGLDLDGIDHLEAPTIATGALPGKSQTINRGELFAFLRFLVGTRGAEKALYVVDSSYVVKGVTRISAGRGHASNVDLWRLVQQELSGRDVACMKIESHMSVADVLVRQVPAGAYLANLIADRAAARAAESCQLPYGEVEGLHWSENLVASVRSRVAATFLHAVENDVRVPPPRLRSVRWAADRFPDASLRRLIRSSGAMATSFAYVVAARPRHRDHAHG